MSPKQQSSEGEYGIPSSYISPVPDEQHPLHKLPLWLLIVVLLVLSSVVVYLLVMGSRFPTGNDVVPMSQSERNVKRMQLEELSSSNVSLEGKLEELGSISDKGGEEAALSTEEKSNILHSLQD